jgi:uncharacterized protein
MTRPTALITGASSGIGYELAKLYAAGGHDLALVARSADAMQDLAREVKERHGAAALVLPHDLTEPGAPQAVFDAVRDRDIDVLVNAAGFADWSPFANADPAKLLAMVNVNVTAITAMTRLVLPGMIVCGNGRVGNLASLAAFEPGPLMAVYHASKAYVLSFSVALAEELRGTGVTVTALCPGPYASTFQERAAMESSKLVQGSKMPSAAETARWAYRQIARGRPVAIDRARWKAGALGFKLMPLTMSARIIRRAYANTEGGST